MKFLVCCYYAEFKEWGGAENEDPKFPDGFDFFILMIDLCSEGGEGLGLRIIYKYVSAISKSFDRFVFRANVKFQRRREHTFKILVRRVRKHGNETLIILSIQPKACVEKYNRGNFKVGSICKQNNLILESKLNSMKS